jgi:hypothetical protein
MKLAILSAVATTIVLVAAAPDPRIDDLASIGASKCTLPCLNTFDKCLHKHISDASYHIPSLYLY